MVLLPSASTSLILELCLSGVLAQQSHHSSQILGGNGAISILVEEGEGFLELCNLFFGQMVSHGEALVSGSQGSRLL